MCGRDSSGVLSCSAVRHGGRPLIFRMEVFVMAGGRPQGAIVSKLKLPASVQAVAPGEERVETMHSKLRPTRPTKPEGLVGELSDAWDEIVDALDEAGLLAQVDGPALELALRHFLVARKASEELLLEGPSVYDEKNEREMKHPASQVFRDHSTAFLEYAKQLGLSFVARARVTVPKGAGDGDSNPFASPAANQ